MEEINDDENVSEVAEAAKFYPPSTIEARLALEKQLGSLQCFDQPINLKSNGESSGFE